MTLIYIKSPSNSDLLVAEVLSNKKVKKGHIFDSIEDAIDYYNIKPNTIKTPFEMLVITDQRIKTNIKKHDR